jgi:uncharacterized protein (DUF2062 family)
MHPPEEHRRQRHSRIRRAKAFLRYMPRRAVFHRYPIIGRFAELARSRPYLWSFKVTSARRALYAGSILALMPLIGVQLPLAFVLALVLRTNLMLLGGLQFLTNPATAWPVYATTYFVGRTVVTATGFGGSVPVELPAEFLGEPVRPPEDHQLVPGEENGRLHWSTRLGNAFNALVIGGVIVGTVIGGILDAVYCWLARRYTLRRAAKDAARHSRSDSTTAPPGAQ